MNPNEVLRIVDSLHRDKNVPQELVFQAIEAALISAGRKYYGEEADIDFSIDRENGAIAGQCDGDAVDHEEMIGRIGAQTAKQVIIQKVREAERDALIGEYSEQIGDMVSGIVQRSEGGAATVALGNVEAILPRSEQIPGESHHPNERVRAIIYEVKPQGSRIKVVLSRTKPKLVQRLFEQEIPEIADGVISVNAIAREPGYRSKVAVSSIDQRVDCVGACVGVRGNRIKNIVDELSGERIDIVRYNEDPEVLIPNALQPAEVDQVILCQMMGRAIVLVREDQLSLAIGRRGQNVRLGSKLSGWDIEIMTQEELEQQIDRAVQGFCTIDGIEEDLAMRLVEEGYLSYDDLEVIEPDDLMEMGSLTAEQVDHIVEQAETRALEAEEAAEIERKRKKEQDRLDASAAANAPPADTPTEAPATEAPAAEAPADEAPADEAPAEDDEAPAEEQPTAEADSATIPESDTAGEQAEDGDTTGEQSNDQESAESNDTEVNDEESSDESNAEAQTNQALGTE